MLNTVVGVPWLLGGWAAVVAIIAVASVAMSANFSTTALLVALSIAPGIVVGLLAHGAPSPTVAQVLHPVEAKDGRS